jgi:hypothetical protein
MAIVGTHYKGVLILSGTVAGLGDSRIDRHFIA